MILKLHSFKFAISVALCFSGCKDKEKSVKSEESHKLNKSKLERNNSTQINRSIDVSRILDSRAKKYLSDEDYNLLKESISSLNNADLSKVIADLSDTRNTSQNKRAFRLLIAELARRDPDSVMSWFLPQNMVPSDAGFTEAAGVLSKSKPSVLESWLTANISKCKLPVQGTCLYSALSALSDIDAKSAFAFLSKVAINPLANNEAINGIFEKYGKQDPVDAEASARSKFSGRDLDLALHNIAMGTSSSNPRLAVQIAGKISDITSRGSALSKQMVIWMESEPEAAVNHLKGFDSKEVQTILQDNPGESGSLLKILGAKNPDMLCELLGKIVITSSNVDIFEAAIKDLTIQNPSSAVALLESMPPGENKMKMIGAQFTRLAQTDSDGALKSASLLTDPNSKTRAYASIAEVVGSSGLEVTLKKANSLPIGDQNNFVSEALRSVIYRNPKEVAEFLTDSVDKNGLSVDAGKKQELITNLGEHLSGTDSTYAQNWLNKMPADEQPAAMKGIASEMARSDIQKLSVFLGSLPRDKTWEAGVRVLIQSLQNSDQEMAQHWQGALNEAGYK